MLFFIRQSKNSIQWCTQLSTGIVIVYVNFYMVDGVSCIFEKMAKSDGLNFTFSFHKLHKKIDISFVRKLFPQRVIVIGLMKVISNQACNDNERYEFLLTGSLSDNNFLHRERKNFIERYKLFSKPFMAITNHV